MGDNLRLLNEFSLEARSLHLQAKECWGDFVISPNFEYIEDEFLTGETARLIAHRKSVVNTIPERFRISMPIILIKKLVNAVLLIQRGYSEALVCTDMIRSELKLMTTYPLSRGPYAAKNFIDPAGCFNELNWAKCFVNDENQSVYRRFELACLYCFEDEIRDLWISTIKHTGRHCHYCGRGSSYVENRYGCIVWLWCHHLDGNSELTELYFDGFMEAYDKGFEYAARFFWDACSDAKKEEIMGDMEEYDMQSIRLFSDPNFFKREGFVNFFYSLLSLEQKRNLISLTAPTGAHFMWSRLLLSRFYECVLRDILTIPLPSSSTTYAYILGELAFKTVELPIPQYQSIFQDLWDPLSEAQQQGILEMNLKIICNLTKAKSMDFLEIVIQPLSGTVKEWLLIYDGQFAGMSALCEFAMNGDYDGLRRYLLLFLVDRDRVTQKLRVRVDSIEILDRFISIYLWEGWPITVNIRSEVNKILGSIRGSLPVLRGLLEQGRMTYQWSCSLTHRD